jgi:hypothetical protein
MSKKNKKILKAEEAAIEERLTSLENNKKLSEDAHILLTKEIDSLLEKMDECCNKIVKK